MVAGSITGCGGNGGSGDSSTTSNTTQSSGTETTAADSNSASGDTANESENQEVIELTFSQRMAHRMIRGQIRLHWLSLRRLA